MTRVMFVMMMLMIIFISRVNEAYWIAFLVFFLRYSPQIFWLAGLSAADWWVKWVGIATGLPVGVKSDSFQLYGSIIMVIYCWVWPFQYSSWRRFLGIPGSHPLNNIDLPRARQDAPWSTFSWQLCTFGAFGFRPGSWQNLWGGFPKICW